MSNIDERIDRLFLDVDIRLREVWEQAFDIDDGGEWDLQLVGELMRMAYGRGYMDALQEPVEGLLLRDHGYRIPQRRQHGE